MAANRIDKQAIRTAFLNVRNDELRRRIFEAVSFNLAHEATWYTKTATKEEALTAHAHRLAAFDKASKNPQAAQFALIAGQLRQQEYINGMERLLERYSKVT